MKKFLVLYSFPMNRSIFRLLLSVLLMAALFSQGVAMASMMARMGMGQVQPVRDNFVPSVQNGAQDMSAQPCHDSLRVTGGSPAKSGAMKHLAHSDVPSKCGSCTGCMGSALINSGMVYLTTPVLRADFFALASVYSSLPAARLERPPRFIS